MNLDTRTVKEVVEKLFVGGSWKTHAIYTEAAKGYGFLDSNGDLIEGTRSAQLEALKDIDELDPKSPSAWVDHLNRKFNKNLNVNDYLK